jgi:adenylosuccinate lyase
VGKEIANFTYRINNQYKHIRGLDFTGKLNGAVGNFNAHMYAYPLQDWPTLSEGFINQLGLKYNPYTTQIEPHDQIALYYSYVSLLNTILIGFSRDMWNYISVGYFK